MTATFSPNVISMNPNTLLTEAVNLESPCIAGMKSFPVWIKQMQQKMSSLTFAIVLRFFVQVFQLEITFLEGSKTSWTYSMEHLQQFRWYSWYLISWQCAIWCGLVEWRDGWDTGSTHGLLAFYSFYSRACFSPLRLSCDKLWKHSKAVEFQFQTMNSVTITIL